VSHFQGVGQAPSMAVAHRLVVLEGLAAAAAAAAVLGV
jgi:hypothetical protein